MNVNQFTSVDVSGRKGLAMAIPVASTRTPKIPRRGAFRESGGPPKATKLFFFLYVRFFPQKAVFWMPVTTCKANFANCYWGGGGIIGWPEAAERLSTTLLHHLICWEVNTISWKDIHVKHDRNTRDCRLALGRCASIWPVQVIRRKPYKISVSLSAMTFSIERKSIDVIRFKDDSLHNLI